MARSSKRRGTDRKRADKEEDGTGQGGGGQNKSFVAFLKKRAPIYLGLTGLFLVFAVPELMSEDLESLLPGEEALGPDERRAMEAVMGYSGQDGDGLTILEAIDIKIKEEFSEDIYNDDSAGVLVEITETDDGSHVHFTFSSDEGSLEYAWSVDDESGDITGITPAADHIIDLVDFYD